MNSRTAALIALALGHALACGCGALPDAGEHGGAPGRDTVRTTVQGREVVIPPPEGMAEILHRSNARTREVAAAGRVVGLFLPHELLPAVRAERIPDHLYVAASAAHARKADDDFIMEGFIRLRSGAFEEDRGPRTPAETALREALDRCVEGDCRPGPPPFGGPRPDSALVRARSPDDRLLQVLRLAWRPDRGGYDHIGSEFVLVNGRMVLLIWTRREPFSIAALADVSESLDRWADAVLAANP